MQRTEATPMDCIVCECPYCGQYIIETGYDIRDMTVPDFEEEGTLQCSFCDKEFEYYIDN